MHKINILIHCFLCVELNIHTGCFTICWHNFRGELNMQKKKEKNLYKHVSDMTLFLNYSDFCITISLVQLSSQKLFEVVTFDPNVGFETSYHGTSHLFKSIRYNCSNQLATFLNVQSMLTQKEFNLLKESQVDKNSHKQNTRSYWVYVY